MLYAARWGVVKVLCRVGGGAVGSLPWGGLAAFPLTWPWGPLSPLQNVDTHYPLWGSGTLAAAGCADQPEMTLLCPGQGNCVGLQKGEPQGHLGQCPRKGGPRASSKAGTTCHLELSCLQTGRCPPDFGDLGQGTSLRSGLRTEERQAEPVTYHPHLGIGKSFL